MGKTIIHEAIAQIMTEEMKLKRRELINQLSDIRKKKPCPGCKSIRNYICGNCCKES